MARLINMPFFQEMREVLRKTNTQCKDRPRYVAARISNKKSLLTLSSIFCNVTSGLEVQLKRARWTGNEYLLAAELGEDELRTEPRWVISN